MADPTPRAEIRELLRLGLPVSLTQLGVMMLGVVDTMMVGHLGTTALDAAALGSLWVWGTAVFGIGLVFGMDPIVSQAHGAGEGPVNGHLLRAPFAPHGLLARRVHGRHAVREFFVFGIGLQHVVDARVLRIRVDRARGGPGLREQRERKRGQEEAAKTGG